MNEAQLPRYDFASAARVERPLRVKLNDWAGKAATLFVEEWGGVSRSKITAVAGNVDANDFGDLQAAWEEACGIAVGFNKDSLTGFLVFGLQDVQVLLADILGGGTSSSEESPEEQAKADEGDGYEVYVEAASDGVEASALTPIEESLVELIFEAAGSSFANGWGGADPLEFEVGEFEPQPKRSRVFAESTSMLATGLAIQLEGASVTLQLVLDKQQAVNLLGVKDEIEPRHNTSVRIAQEKISAVEIEVGATLGQTELLMKDLVSLEVGDVIVLDQKVNHPVQLAADGQVICEAWPGKQAGRQVLKVSSLAE